MTDTSSAQKSSTVSLSRLANVFYGFTTFFLQNPIRLENQVKMSRFQFTQHVFNTNQNVARTCPFKVFLQFSKRLEDVKKTYWASPICNAFWVTDTYSTCLVWKRCRHVLVTSDGTLGNNLDQEKIFSYCFHI